MPFDNDGQQTPPEPHPTPGWVARLASGNPDEGLALSELRSRLERRLTSALGSKPGVDEAFIEDVVQDALVKILDSLDQFEGRSQFTTWATTIATRTAFTEMRRRRWRDTSLDQLLDSEVTQGVDAPASSNVQSLVEKADFVKAMYQGINDHLTEKQRTALLAELRGMPMEEIGRLTGCSRNTIYKVTHDARKRLKKFLIEAGYSAADLSSFQE